MPRSIDNHGLIRKIGTTTRTVSERPKHSDIDPDAFSDELERQSDEDTQETNEDDETRHPLLRSRDGHASLQESDLDADGQSDSEESPMIYDPQDGSAHETNELRRGRAVDLEA